MRADDLLRRLRRRSTKLGVDHEETPAADSHVKVRHGACRTILPMHRADLPTGTFKAVLKQLGLSEHDLEF